MQKIFKYAIIRQNFLKEKAVEDISAYKLACCIARTLDNKKGGDIKILNIANVSVLADYFVICSGDSATQVKALSEYAKAKMKEVFQRIPCGDEKDIKNRWNLIDYGDVVVHGLHKEERETYAIEKFWNHAFTVEEEKWLAESEVFEDLLR